MFLFRLMGSAMLILAAMTAMPVAAAPGAQDGIVYGKTEDKITIKVKDQPLAAVLLDIARQTGLAVRLDPAVNKPVTLDITALPLATAIDRLTSRLNTIKQFREVKVGGVRKNLLIGITVLPEGQVDASRARDLLDMDKELELRAGQGAKEAVRVEKRMNMTMARWAEREKGLSPDRKKRLDALRDKLTRDRLANAQKDEAQRAERAAKAAERQQRHDARRAQTGESKPAYDPELAKKAATQFAQPKVSPVMPEE